LPVIRGKQGKEPRPRLDRIGAADGRIVKFSHDDNAVRLGITRDRCLLPRQTVFVRRALVAELVRK
jgi:hypothetical protein